MTEPAGHHFRPGEEVFIASDSSTGTYSTVFEDNGETGYFYAYDRQFNSILDAVHIYNVSSVIDRHLNSVAEIVWSEDGLKSALLINRYPHAIFDFAAKRGYCRTNFPNVRPATHGRWKQSTHQWDDAVMRFFRIS